MVNWKIRQFTMEDHAQVYCLWRAAGAGLQLRPSDSYEEVEKRLQRDPELFLVADTDDGIIGVVMGGWDGRRGWLHHLAVCQEHQRHGIATALVHAVEDQLRSKGCLKVNLLVFAENTAARQFYAVLGYDEMRPVIAMGKEL